MSVIVIDGPEKAGKSTLIEALKTELAEYEKNKAQKIDVARAALYDMLLNKDDKSADELEKELSEIKAQKLNDSQITDLIFRVQKKIDDMRSSGGGSNLSFSNICG